MFCLVHDVGEYAELRLRRGGDTPAPPETAIHSRLEFMMEFMSMLAKSENAGSEPFKLVWHFEGPGGGAWTLSVANGNCDLEEGRAADSDVVMTTTFENFEKMTRKMSNPMWMMLTRQLKMKGFFKMRKMSKIFAEPAPDDVLIRDGHGPLAVG
jgi:putative sterol carrier protein